MGECRVRSKAELGRKPKDGKGTKNGYAVMDECGVWRRAELSRKLESR